MTTWDHLDSSLRPRCPRHVTAAEGRVAAASLSASEGRARYSGTSLAMSWRCVDLSFSDHGFRLRRERIEAMSRPGYAAGDSFITVRIG